MKNGVQLLLELTAFGLNQILELGEINIMCRWWRQHFHSQTV